MSRLAAARWHLALIMAAVAASTLAGTGCRSQETIMPTTSILNSARFGDPQARSYLPLTGDLGREIRWTHDSGDADGQPALHLMRQDDQLIALYPERLVAHAADRGQERWGREVSPSFEFHLVKDGMATMDENGRYTVYDFAGKKAAATTLPLLAEVAHLFASESLQGELRYAFAEESVPESDPADPDSPEALVYHRFDPSEIDFFWRFKREDVLIQVLRHANPGRISLIGGRAIYSFATDCADDADVTTLTCEAIEAAALDLDDHWIVALREDGERRLRRIRPDGATDWEVPLPGGAIVQPPAIAPGGHAYIVVGGELVHVADGAIDWRYTIPFTGEYRPLITVLGDRRILLTAGTNLIQLRPDGQEQVRVETGSALTCRPVMDADGRVYVGSEAWLRCYQ